jgi:hypothetical protein
MKTFMALERLDSNKVFIDALLRAGFTKVSDPDRADCLFYEYCKGKHQFIYDKFFGKKPTFIYPHTPYSWWIWDGLYEPVPACCNFVTTDAAKNAMAAYGYPYRVESIGFTRARVRKFSPTDGKTILFAPNHPTGAKGKLIRDEDYIIAKQSFERIISMAPKFKQIIVRYGGSLLGSGIWDPKISNIILRKSDMTTPGTQKAIEAADIVIARGTLAYISVAMGKPTIGPYLPENAHPYSHKGDTKSFDKYRWIQYPVNLNDVTDDQIIEFAKYPNREVETWKEQNIGRNFNPEKFISIVREFV